MNGYWLRLPRLLLLSSLAACTTGKFSEDFSTEIQRDCIETVGCTQVGQIEGCIAAVGDYLNNAKTSQQQFFVDAVYRCEGSRMCEWVKCTQSTNATGPAASLNAEITYDCQQRSMCRLASGQPVATDAVNMCIQETGNRLNADPQEAANFQARYQRCSSMAACSFGACQ
jgi:hypothetical protein